jgi:hypothetical protein
MPTSLCALTTHPRHGSPPHAPLMPPSCPPHAPLMPPSCPVCLCAAPQERSLALLGFVAQLLNSVIVLMLVNANINGIGTAATAMEFSFLNGSYTDFTQVGAGVAACACNALAWMHRSAWLSLCC